MQFSWTLFTIVLLLGVLQIAVGMVVGKCSLPGKRRGESRARAHLQHVRQSARHLFDVANNMVDDVDQHQSEITRVSEELASMPTGRDSGVTKTVLGTVAQIMQINERLQERLGEAERRLQEQSRQIEAQLTEARTDPLTGLPNRRAFDDELSRRVAEWRRKNSMLSLIMVDIDHFKSFNDRFGHDTGDRVLRMVAQSLASNVRSFDVVARWGGEEFVVILEKVDLEELSRRAGMLRRLVEASSLIADDEKLSVTVSIGGAIARPGEDSSETLKRADGYLYRSKEAGRNRVTCG